VGSHAEDSHRKATRRREQQRRPRIDWFNFELARAQSGGCVGFCVGPTVVAPLLPLRLRGLSWRFDRRRATALEKREETSNSNPGAPSSRGAAEVVAAEVQRYSFRLSGAAAGVRREITPASTASPSMPVTAATAKAYATARDAVLPASGSARNFMPPAHLSDRVFTGLVNPAHPLHGPGEAETADRDPLRHIAASPAGRRQAVRDPLRHIAAFRANPLAGAPGSALIMPWPVRRVARADGEVGW
jgi:hypothetical protein